MAQPRDLAPLSPARFTNLTDNSKDRLNGPNVRRLRVLALRSSGKARHKTNYNGWSQSWRWPFRDGTLANSVASVEHAVGVHSPAVVGTAARYLNHRRACAGYDHTKKGAETMCVSSALASPLARTHARVRSLSLNDRQTFAASAASSLFADRSASFVVDMGVVYHEMDASSS